MLFFISSLASGLRQAGRIRTAETYLAAAASLSRFLHHAAPALPSSYFTPERITPQLMLSYESWLREEGLTANTSSFYMRVLRAAYNQAVEQRLTPDLQPFGRVYTGIAKTRKRAISIDEIRRLRRLDLRNQPSLDFARDMFIMSFLLRGMSFVDMAFLKQGDLRHGILSYRRRKTGQQLHIAWTPEMQSILNKYPRNPSQYLLPILGQDDVKALYRYRSMGCMINRNLKKVACLAGIKTQLSLYVARHSWASAARAKGIPLGIISEGMGHDSERTTRIYLASLDSTCVDQANSLIIASIL